MRVVALADGKMFKLDGANAVELPSRFAEQMLARSLAIVQRNAWKTSGSGARFRGAGLSAPQESLAGVMPEPRVTSICAGVRPGELLYVLNATEVSALVAVEPDGEERRLMHSAEWRLYEVCAAPDGSRIVCSVRGAGVGQLVSMPPDGGRVTVLTEGDVLDGAPRWTPDGAALLYQSSGVGRDATGQFAGHGPSSLCLLPVDGGETVTLVEHPAMSVMTPAQDRSGDLWFLRQPWRTIEPVSLWAMVKMVVLAPYRLARAVLGWLDFFTVRWSGEPLVTHRGERASQEDPKRWLMEANILAATRGVRGPDASVTVSPERVLVRRRPDGVESEIAAGVSAFTLDGSGGALYADGVCVWHLRADGRREELARLPRVVALACLEDARPEA